VSALGLAHEYVSRGWPVFPVAPRSKEPFGRLAPRGVYSATLDALTLERWFRAAPDLNVGIACGDVSGFFALDVDPRNQGDETLGALEAEHGSLPITPRSLTGGDGLHALYRMPTAARLVGKIGPGLEIKSTGGYIVAPPSVHPSGGRYRWDLGALPTETPIADAPPWLLELACGAQRPALAPAVGRAADTFFAAAFAAAGWLGRELHNGAIAARCPWLESHTDDRGDGHDSSTVLLPPTHDARIGAFKCSHAHCVDRGRDEVLRTLPKTAIAVARAAHPAAFRCLVYVLARAAAGRSAS
jgi:hypothetical protein